MLLYLAALQSLCAVTVCDTPEDTTKVITPKPFFHAVSVLKNFQSNLQVPLHLNWARYYAVT